MSAGSVKPEDRGRRAGGARSEGGTGEAAGPRSAANGRGTDTSAESVRGRGGGGAIEAEGVGPFRAYARARDDHCGQTRAQAGHWLVQDRIGRSNSHEDHVTTRRLSKKK